MASLAIVLTALFNAHCASAAATVMTVNMPQSNNWVIGTTLNSNLQSGQASPFTEQSMADFQTAWDNKDEWLQQGTFRMTADVVSSQSEAVESMKVSASLEVTYMMFSGDAHMSFAKDNIQSALDVSVIVKASADGRKQQMSLADTNGLALKGTSAATIEEFEQMYGSYLIVGFEYGGDILFKSTHSAKSAEDKMSISAGLNFAYKSAGFSIAGSVDTSYDQSDISKSVSTSTDYSIRPNSQGADVDSLISTLNALSFGDAAGHVDMYASMAQSAQNVLSGADTDPIKAIVIPLSSVSAVNDFFLDNPVMKDTVPFMSFLNEMYQSVEGLLKQLALVETQWELNSPETTPDSVFGDWEHLLKELLREMQVINTVTDISEASDAYLASNADWNADPFSADSFIDITSRHLENLFDDAIMEPYNAMLGTVTSVLHSCALRTWKINFQDKDFATPSGYEADSGEPYGPRSSGDLYGWDCDISDDNTDIGQSDGMTNKGGRTFTAGDDALTNSLVVPDRFGFCANEKTTWKILVPNGLYSVTMGFTNFAEWSTAGCTLQGSSLGTGVFPISTSLNEVTRTVTVNNQFIEFKGGHEHDCHTISTIVVEEMAAAFNSAKRIYNRVDLDNFGKAHGAGKSKNNGGGNINPDVVPPQKKNINEGYKFHGGSFGGYHYQAPDAAAPAPATKGWPETIEAHPTMFTLAALLVMGTVCAVCCLCAYLVHVYVGGARFAPAKQLQVFVEEDSEEVAPMRL